MEGQQPAFIQLSGGQGAPGPPPGHPGQPHGHPGNFNGPQEHQGRVVPTPPPPPPMGQMPHSGNQVRGPQIPHSAPAPPNFRRPGPHGAPSPQNQMVRQPQGQGQLSNPSPHLSEDLHRRRKVEVHDLHSECRTESEARERLSTYVVIFMTKTDVPNELDEYGYPLLPTWDKTTHSQQPDISHQEANRKVRELEGTTDPVSDKKQDLPTPLQLQFDYAQDQLESAERDPRYHYVLAQFASKIKKVEVSPIEPHRHIEGPKKSKHRSSSRDRHRDRSKGKSKYKSKKYWVEPHRSKPKRRKERVSVTAYFKRTPKPGENCMRMLQELEEYGRGPEMGLVPASMHTSGPQFPGQGQHLLPHPSPGQNPHGQPPQGPQGLQFPPGHGHDFPHQGPQGPQGPQRPDMQGPHENRMPPPGQPNYAQPVNNPNNPHGQQNMQQPHQKQGNAQQGQGGHHHPPPPPHMQHPHQKQGNVQQGQGGHHPPPPPPPPPPPSHMKHPSPPQPTYNNSGRPQSRQGKRQVEIPEKKPKVYPGSPRSSLSSLMDEDNWSDSVSGFSTPQSSIDSDYDRGRHRTPNQSRSRSRHRPEHFGVPRRRHSKSHQLPKIIIPTPTPPPPHRASLSLVEPPPFNPRRNGAWMDDIDPNPRGIGRNAVAPRIIQGVRRISPGEAGRDVLDRDIDLLGDRFDRMKFEDNLRGRGREYARDDLYDSRSDERYRRRTRLDDIYADDWRRPSPRRRADEEVDDYLRSRRRPVEMEPGHPFDSGPRRETYHTALYR